jgi:hypothetical protein
MAVPARRPAPVPALAATAALVLMSMALSACATGAGSPPGPSAVPTPTPVPTVVAAPVSSPEDAAARVIATDPRFAGATMLQPGSVGLTKWWEWLALDSGGYEIKLTLGWGDCPAGCIDHHTWIFDVAADGTVTKVSESGDEVIPNI